MSDKKLLEVKKQLRAKKPVFVRQDAHKKKRVGVKWRAPKGRQSKMRLNKKGYAPALQQGYSSPKSLRGCHFDNGKELVTVATVKELALINSQKQMIVIANVGTKKRYELVKTALDKNIEILNIEDASGFVSAVEGLMKNRKEARKQVVEKRKAKEEKKKEKKAVEEKVTEEPADEKTKKEEAKKEKDKVLTSAKEQY